MGLNYYVYEINLTDEKGNTLSERVNFCCSDLRWMSLEKEIKQGDFLMDLSTIKKIYETKDRNEARRMATEY